MIPITSSQKTSITNSEAFNAHWQNKIEDLLSTGKASGADFVEIFLENIDYISALAEQDTITSVSPSFGKGAGIRVFRNGRDGFVSTNDLTDKGLGEALEKALSMLGLDASNSQVNQFNGLEILRDYGRKKEDWLAQSPSLNEASQVLLLGNKHIEQYGKHINVRRGNYSRSWQEILVAASDGTFARDVRLHQSLGFNVLSSHKENLSNVGRRYGSSGSPDDIRDWDSERSAKDLCDSAQKMLYANYVEAGQMPVVLANKFGGVIFHEACGHLLETTQIERGTSPFADKLNKSIAHPSVTAIDEGNTQGAFGSLDIDDEGMEPQKTVLIENGILKKFISDRAGELRTGHKRTGSGRRQNHTYAPASRMRNTYIAPGSYTPDELINSIEDGLYCKSMGGGSVGPTGQFNFSVEEGYLIKNGKLEQPVKGATLIGEAKQVLPRISMCANDLDLAAGFCGSISGNIYVTVGQPHIKVESITVGGR